MSHTATRVIGEICRITSSKRIYRSDYVEEGVPFFRSKEVIERFNGRQVSTELFISEQRYETIRAKFGVPQSGDLLLTSVGTLGVPYLVHPDDRFYFKDGNLTWFRCGDELVPRYLYYWLISPQGKAQQNKARIGSSQAAYTIELLKKMEIAVPRPPVQRRIADILSAYDDLIENNSRRMDLLEESIHLLYREWFVYLRFPGHERTEIVDGVPTGWRRATVGSVLARIPTRRKVPKNEYQDSGAIPTVDQSRDFIGGYTDDLSALYTAEQLPLIIFGDHTRILKFIDFPFARGADGTQVLSPVPGAITPHFLYFALSAVDLSEFGYARHLKYLKSEEILVPTPTTVVAFDEIARSALKQVSILREQNQKLREARDLLLPRLMDGRIPV